MTGGAIDVVAGGAINIDSSFVGLRTYEGTGLGLAITSGIVQLMDASITVESRKGQGSDFIVSFQKADGPRRQARRMPGLGHRANA